MRSLRTILPLALAAACARPDTGSPAGQSVPAASASAGMSPTAAVVVLYNQPKDTAAFEKYYNATHVPLAASKQGEIGYTRIVLTKFEPGADGKRPPFYRKAELWFDSPEDRAKGMATPGFKTVAEDLPKFATGGVVVMTSRETNK